MEDNRAALRRTGILAISLVLVLSLAAIAMHIRSHRVAPVDRRPHYDNTARARTLRTGMSRREVIDLLGDPEGERSGWSEFTPSPPDGRTIRVKFDDHGRVAVFNIGTD